MNRILSIFLFLLFGCTDHGTDISKESLQLSVEDSIREAVYRYQFEHNASGQQQNAKVYFLSVMMLDDSTGYWNDSDPSGELLYRFANNVPPVKPFSECTLSISGVFDIETGERGLLFQVGDIRWVANDQVEVDGGYFEAGLSASGNTYYLKYSTGQWTVTQDVMHWIS